MLKENQSAKKEKVTLKDTATSILVKSTTKFGQNNDDYSQGHIEDASKREPQEQIGTEENLKTLSTPKQLMYS